MEIKETHRKLTILVEKYIKAIILNYGKYMSPEVINKLQTMDYNSIIKIYNTNTINGYVSDDMIHFPLCADRILKIIGKIPGYASNVKHKIYNDDNLIDNNNTFLKYVIHVFISGTDADGYYEDLLLHETVHLCGSDGTTAIREGLTEFLTRKLAKQYGFRTNSCAYPKEVAIINELQNILGEEAINKITFMKLYEIMSYLESEFGIDVKILFDNIMDEMEKEFNSKYIQHVSSFDGIFGIVKKIHCYNQIDYSGVYELLDEYKKKSNKYR